MKKTYLVEYKVYRNAELVEHEVEEVPHNNRTQAAEQVKLEMKRLYPECDVEIVSVI